MLITVNEILRSIETRLTSAPPPARLDNAPAPFAPEPIERARFLGPWQGEFTPLPNKEPPLPRDEDQARVREKIVNYLKEPTPGRALVLAAPTSWGKTYLLSGIASQLAEAGHYVFWAGPRRKFFSTLIEEVEKQGFDSALWRQWLARQTAEQALETGGYETCYFADQINVWLERGYEAIEFCKRSCGWSYVQDECAYYQQAYCKEKAIYGHHNHLWLGNTLLERHSFDLVIGDEEPLSSAVLRPWYISAKALSRTAHADSLISSVTGPLWALMQKDELGHAETGAGLIAALGGPESVLETCERFQWLIKQSAGILVPDDIGQTRERNEAAIEDLQPNFLPDLTRLLAREARYILDNPETDYLSRVVVHPKGKGTGLTLLLRRFIHTAIPRHIIWCDATPEQHVYEAALEMPVEIIRANMIKEGRIYQVATRANGKTVLIEQPEDSVSKLTEAAQQVERLLEAARAELESVSGRWGVVTFMDAEHKFVALGAETMHFGGARGANDFRTGEEKMDAGFVVGTPQPKLSDLISMAKMIWSERMEPYDATWEDRPYPFAGTDTWYFRSGFWKEAELMALLWMKRESEIIQAAGRFGYFRNALPVFILSSLPLDDLPPDKLLTIKDIFEAPARVEPHRWGRCVEIARFCCEEYFVLSSQMLHEQLELWGLEGDRVSLMTAQRYLHYLGSGKYGFVETTSVLASKGRKAKVLILDPGDQGPEGVDPAYWVQIVYYARQAAIEKNGVEVSDLQQMFGWRYKEEAIRYIRLLVEHANFELVQSILYYPHNLLR